MARRAIAELTRNDGTEGLTAAISMMRKQRLGERKEKSPEPDEAHSSIIAGVAHLRPVRGITFTTNNAAKFVKRSDNGLGELAFWPF